MLSLQLWGAILALASAMLYGAGDFSGGLASRRSSQFQVIVLVSLTNVILMTGLALAWQESIPELPSLVWAALAGIFGALGLVALYRGLSTGNAAIVAPTAGVVGAAVPVLFVAMTEGLPKSAQLVGFAAAILGIWLVTQNESTSAFIERQSLAMGVLSGIGFGAFFMLIAQVESDSPFAPLVVAKISSLFIGLILLRISKQSLPSVRGNGLMVLAGVLDGTANALYFWAQRFTRLDIAVVLTSLYPAATVFLSYVILREKISRLQMVGVMFCLLAIALIVM